MPIWGTFRLSMQHTKKRVVGLFGRLLSAQYKEGKQSYRYVPVIALSVRCKCYRRKDKGKKIRGIFFRKRI